MIQIADDGRLRAFRVWLRTGRLPDEIEFKFNHWHDPADGRFTFAGSGRYYGAGGAGPGNRASDGAPRIVDRDARRRPRIATTPRVEAPRQPERYGKTLVDRRAIQARPKPESRCGDQPNPAAEFARGVGEGLYSVAEQTVTGTYSALTTNPVTTVRNVGSGIAGMIDTAIAAEDTPARVQVSRAADAIANASAREIGRATGSVASSAALAAAPGAALGKVSAVRHLSTARPRPAYDPPQIGWVKETLKRDEDWSVYNDTAPGARPGQAPTLMRTMPDGSKRPVKFDGVEGDFVIDRKWGVRDQPRARAQLLRQSAVLAQHRLIATWEVRTPAERIKALKLFKKMGVINIKVRVVKP